MKDFIAASVAFALATSSGGMFLNVMRLLMDYFGTRPIKSFSSFMPAAVLSSGL